MTDKPTAQTPYPSAGKDKPARDGKGQAFEKRRREGDANPGESDDTIVEANQRTRGEDPEGAPRDKNPSRRERG